MPWKALKGGGCSGAKPYAVVKTSTGQTVSCHTSKEKAVAAVRALYANEAMAAVPFTGGGGMVALYPDPAEANAIAQPDGQAAGDLHVTLCFLPYSADPSRLGPILTGIAEKYQQLKGDVSGVGEFKKGDSGVPVVSLPSVVGLDRLRVEIARALDDAGIVYAINYGFIPHLTLGYDLATLPTSVLGTKISFDSITFMDSGTRHDYPFQVPDQETTQEQEGKLATRSEIRRMALLTIRGRAMLEMNRAMEIKA